MFENFTLADEPFTKALRTLKLMYQLIMICVETITFDEKLKVTSGSFFISGWNLLSCKLHNFTFKVLY